MSDMNMIDDAGSQSVWSALLSIIDKPGVTFTNLLAEPRLKWLLPLVLSVLVLIISAGLTAPYASQLAQTVTERQLQSAGASPEQLEEMQARSAAFTSPLVTALSGAIGGTIGLVLMWLIATTFFYFTALIAGAELKFGDVLIVVSWSALPIALRTLIQTIYTVVTQKFPIYPGLAALQVSGDPLQDSRNPLIVLLGYADPFWLWQFGLLVVGLAVAARFSKVKSFFIVLLYSLLAIGVSVGLIMLSRTLTGGG